MIEYIAFIYSVSAELKTKNSEMATPVSDTLREGEVRLEIEKPPSPTDVGQKMDDDSVGEGYLPFDLQEGPYHAEEPSGDTSGGGDNHSHVEPEPPAQDETNEKADFVLVYETWQENEDDDEETQTKARDYNTHCHPMRETFETNLVDAGLDIIRRKDTKPSPVSSLLLLISLRIG